MTPQVPDRVVATFAYLARVDELNLITDMPIALALCLQYGVDDVADWIIDNPVDRLGLVLFGERPIEDLSLKQIHSLPRCA